MDWQKDYFLKFKDVDEAVKVVKSGDTVAYGEFVMASAYLDEALAKRVTELDQVILRSTSCPFQPKVVLADPEMKHVMYNDWHFTVASRKLCDQDLCRYIPINYHIGPDIIRTGKVGKIDVAMFMMGPPDEEGYLNIGTSSSLLNAYMGIAKYIIVEINERIPYCFCDKSSRIHVSQVDCFVEGPNSPMVEVPSSPPTDVDKKIAELVVDQISDGACIQLGIGTMPNAVGTLIGASGLRNLGVHTEMLCDAYVSMYEGGCITGKFKKTNPGKIIYTFAVGTNKLYHFLDNNPECVITPVDYTNDPFIIAQNDNMVCLNNALEIDLYGQIASESTGYRQISGTGGQLDFIMASHRSKGGKGIVCLSSTYTDGEGKLHSRIRGTLDPCTIITVPRSYAPIIITEYGVADLRGKTTWERAELLISIAHPAFREELIKEAEKNHIWDRRTFQM